MMRSGAGTGQWWWFVNDIDCLGIVVLGGSKVGEIQVKRAIGLQGSLYEFDGQMFGV